LNVRFVRAYAYVLAGTFLAVPTFVLSLLGIVFSALSLLTVGVPFLVGVLWLARGSILYFRGPARKLLGWEWAGPRPVRLRGLLGDAAAWKALAYCFLTFPVKFTAAYVGGASFAVGAYFLTSPAWWFLSPRGIGIELTPVWSHTWWYFAQGLVAVGVIPWFVRCMVWLDKLLAYGLLQPSRDRERIAQLEAGRAALQSDAAALLRRVERDLHDGTQARLVALGVTMSRLEKRMPDPATRDLLASARAGVTEALAELRDIVRGMHPPALDDGLEVALSTLVARSAVPVQLQVTLSTRPSEALSSAVYFTVAELLTNIARHSRAARAWVSLADDDGWLRLSVRDDGRGGAGVSSGTGLPGLSRRAAALDGSLTVDSPPGGPTVVTVSFSGKA
jgi:signal transduction histidine kinase